jgi:hypothetical protein
VRTRGSCATASHAPLNALRLRPALAVEGKALTLVEANGPDVSVQHPQERGRVTDRGGVEGVTDPAPVGLSPHVQGHQLKAWKTRLRLVSPRARTGESQEPRIVRFPLCHPFRARLAAKNLMPPVNPTSAVCASLQEQLCRHEAGVGVIPHVEVEISQSFRVLRSSGPDVHRTDARCTPASDHLDSVPNRNALS